MLLPHKSISITIKLINVSIVPYNPYTSAYIFVPFYSYPMSWWRYFFFCLYFCAFISLPEKHFLSFSLSKELAVWWFCGSFCTKVSPACISASVFEVGRVFCVLASARVTSTIALAVHLFPSLNYDILAGKKYIILQFWSLLLTWHKKENTKCITVNGS